MVEGVGQKICIINSYEVANDLLNDRSLIYSYRPPMPMVNDLCVLFQTYYLLNPDILQNGLCASMTRRSSTCLLP